MKKTLLEQIIYLSLFEQTSNEDDWIEVPDVVPEQRHNKVKPVSRKALGIAHANGAVLSGWSAFTIKSVYTVRQGLKSALSSEPGLAWSDSKGAAEAIEQATTANRQESYYGPTGHFDQAADSNGIAPFMYIVGPDVSSRKRVRKHNVWVCNFSHLFYLSRKLDQIEPLQYFERVENFIKNKSLYVNNIIVFDFKDIAKWFSVLKQRISKLTPDESKKLSADLKPQDSNVLIPNLNVLSRDYDPDSDVIDLKPTIITITDANASEYRNIDFRGKGRLDYDAFGNKIISPLEGNISVSREDDGMDGTFTGTFKNGTPYDGKVVYKDGDTFDGIFPEDAVKVIVNPNGSRNFQFMTSKGIPRNSSKAATIKTAAPEVITTTSDVITYPNSMKFTDGVTYNVYTTGPTDPYVYIYDKKTRVWLYADKKQYEKSLTSTGDNVSFYTIPPRNKKAYKKLNALL